MNSSHSLSNSASNIFPHLQLFARTFNLCVSSLRQRLMAGQKPLLMPLRIAIQRWIDSRLQQHPGGYCYIPIFCHRLGELLILQWAIGSESKPHSHLASLNFTKVLSGQVLERKYHISGGQLRVISERVVKAGQWAWTLPFEIHELVALDTTAATIHLYLPGRVC